MKILAGVGEGLTANLVRQARLDLVVRMAFGLYAVPIVFVVTGIATDYRRDHPGPFWSLVGAVIVATAMRIILVAWRERIYDRNSRLFVWLVTVAIILSSSPCGVLYASALWFYGYQNWSFIAVLFLLIGIPSGSIITYTPNLKFMRLTMALLLAPALSLGLFLHDARGRIFAFSTGSLVIFLLLQGRRLHVVYWTMLRDKALESLRARELEAAKMAAETARMAAEAANRARGQFLANTSHEIRTPMHGILGMAQLALTAETTQEANEYITTVRNCAEGLLSILNDVLDFSKIEAGKLTLENIPFSLRQMLNDVREIVLPQTRIKGLALECHISEEVPDQLIGDPMRLRQVLVNLMSNATKFTVSGTIKLEISKIMLDQSSSQINLHFLASDTGIGMSEEQQKNLFQAFSQVDSTVARRFGGTGLGLAICSQLVKMMGGAISVESKLNAGSAFQFTCPLGLGEEQLASVHPDQPLATEAPLRILVADDNLVNQTLARKLLRRRGHLVKVVSSGQAAVQAWEQEELDLILMDDQMPIMDGLEAVRQIRALETAHNRGRTPIIAVTASAMKGDRERFLAAGMDSYLAKPFSAEQLYACLASFTDSPLFNSQEQQQPANIAMQV